MALVNEELRVVVDGSGDRACVKVEGELDVASARVLRDVLEAAIASEVGHIDVDMSLTTFCDSAGLTVLLTGRRQFHLAARQLRIVRASRPVLRLLDLTGTRQLLSAERTGAATSGPPGRLAATVACGAEAP